MEIDGKSMIAHELFHHWFGDLVTTESWSNITLNESFADYSEYFGMNTGMAKMQAMTKHFKEKQELFSKRQMITKIL